MNLISSSRSGGKSFAFYMQINSLITKSRTPWKMKRKRLGRKVKVGNVSTILISSKYGDKLINLSDVSLRQIKF